MRKYLGLIAALVFAASTIAPVTTVSALGEEKPAKEVTKEEAAKKYPPPAGKSYPVGIPTSVNTGSGGFIQSPYSSRVYDCRKVKHGALLLDEGVSKVFVMP